VFTLTSLELRQYDALSRHRPHVEARRAGS
jgi:hypothetical protein